MLDTFSTFVKWMVVKLEFFFQLKRRRDTKRQEGAVIGSNNGEGDGIRQQI
jgi:hypothetical protein